MYLARTTIRIDPGDRGNHALSYLFASLALPFCPLARTRSWRAHLVCCPKWSMSSPPMLPVLGTLAPEALVQCAPRTPLATSMLPSHRKYTHAECTSIVTQRSKNYLSSVGCSMRQSYTFCRGWGMDGDIIGGTEKGTQFRSHEAYAVERVGHDR